MLVQYKVDITIITANVTYKILFISAKTIQTKFDASTLHENRQLAAETQMFDDGSGRAEV